MVLILRPFVRVIYNIFIFPDAVQVVLLANNVFIIIALPGRTSGAIVNQINVT
jgi:hypothetical protein